MKQSASLVCCSLLLGLGVDGAVAQPVTVQVTGHVTQVIDDTGLIGLYVAYSQPVTATYTYDTVEPTSPFYWDPPTAVYAPPPTQTNFKVNAGPFTFLTGSSSQFQIQVGAGVPGSAYGLLWLDAYNNPPLSNGVTVDGIVFDFQDPSGQWPTSTAPPVSAPGFTNFVDSQLTVSGAYYQITIQIDSATLLPPALEIAPATGRFLPQQHFDAAVWLPAAGAAISTMQASVGGVAVALNYPGTCQLAPANSAAQPALLCPGADAALTSLQGLTQIDWLVTFADGSSVTQSVQWNLVR